MNMLSYFKYIKVQIMLLTTKKYNQTMGFEKKLQIDNGDCSKHIALKNTQHSYHLKRFKLE